MNQALDVYNHQWLANQQNGLQGGSYLAPHYIYTVPPLSRPSSLELVIEKLPDDSIRLDYGAEIRLLMAEPVKGMKLREAIQLLKEALWLNLDPHP
jgi:hypothetical protein